MLAPIMAIAAALVSVWFLASLISRIWTYLTRGSDVEASDTPASN